mmetsp:Transcript_5416/g.12862  ORF Transcript_5416/g.12862 Transcript_5416/m.12862 type:complete len:82 (+) Transcript_5416:207-452(+)
MPLCDSVPLRCSDYCSVPPLQSSLFLFWLVIFLMYLLTPCDTVEVSEDLAESALIHGIPIQESISCRSLRLRLHLRILLSG